MIEQIRSWLDRYLDSTITLRQFQEWFVPATWDIHNSPEADAKEFAYNIELRLAEYTTGHLSESELRGEHSNGRRWPDHRRHS